MDKEKDLIKLRKKIAKVQDDKRFEHTLGVEFTAASLAMRYGCDLNQARIAGILHDCAKCISDEKKLQLCKKYGIIVTDVERRNPFLLHAKVGAVLAKEKYGIKDEDIRHAIEYHTTGREGMSLLEKIIFVSDYIEPGRKHAKNLGEIRKLAFEDLDKALLQILNDTLDYLQSKNGEIDPCTERTRNYYQEIKH